MELILLTNFLSFCFILCLFHTKMTLIKHILFYLFLYTYNLLFLFIFSFANLSAISFSNIFMCTFTLTKSNSILLSLISIHMSFKIDLLLIVNHLFLFFILLMQLM